MIYNGRVMTEEQLLRLRSYLVLKCWQEVQERQPFTYCETANVVKKLTLQKHKESNLPTARYTPQNEFVIEQTNINFD